MSYFRGVQQLVSVDPLNCSVINISGSGQPSSSFTGSAASTLGVVGIQIGLKSDVNCIVYIDQSNDTINWDITDSYHHHVGVGSFGITVQAIGAYERVRVVNESINASTYFRLSTVLCPIVEAVPRSLTEYGNMKVAVNEINGILGTAVEVSPRGALRVESPVKIAGSLFVGTKVDPNFFITSSYGTNTLISQANGRLLLHVSSSNGSASIQTNRTGRYVAGTSNLYYGNVRPVGQTGSCIQRWGAYTTSSGYFFEVSNSVFGVGYISNGVSASVHNGEFNGMLGTTIHTFDTTTMSETEIYWNTHQTWWILNKEMIHSVVGTVTPLSDIQSLPARAEVFNTNGNMNVNDMYTRTQTILRLGELIAENQYGRVTTAATQILKYSSGRLSRVVLNLATGTVINIYDGISASGILLAVITAGSSQAASPTTLEYGIPFQTGLTVVSTGTWDATIIYE